MAIMKARKRALRPKYQDGYTKKELSEIAGIAFGSISYYCGLAGVRPFPEKRPIKPGSMIKENVYPRSSLVRLSAYSGGGAYAGR